MQSTLTPTDPTSKILAALALLGYVEGPPPHLDAGTVAIDRRVYSAMKCSQCRRGRMHFLPMHRGREYRAVAACCHCGHAEEV
jgi:hypothetical protein